jgi:hypothetical protein
MVVAALQATLDRRSIVKERDVGSRRARIGGVAGSQGSCDIAAGADNPPAIIRLAKIAILRIV